MPTIGAIVIVGVTVYLSQFENPNTRVALWAIGIAFVVWLVALVFGREGEQAWARSAQVAFLVLALGQVSTVTLNLRSQEASEARIRREDSRSERWGIPRPLERNALEGRNSTPGTRK